MAVSRLTIAYAHAMEKGSTKNTTQLLMVLFLGFCPKKYGNDPEDAY